MEMIMTAGMVTAQDAYRTGLVNHVVQRTNYCISLANKIIKNSPYAIGKAITVNVTSKKKNGYETEIKAFGKCFGTQDFKKRQRLLREKKSSLGRKNKEPIGSLFL
jgi:enoyl-CoA hydratase